MANNGGWAGKIGWRPAPATLIGAGLVLLGFLLADVSWWFVVLCGAGAFGPGLLRELGWLQDKDEFHRRTAQRAGYHAYLVTGLLAFVLVGYLRSGERHLKNPEELATLFLALLWFTWLLSSSLSYWGPRKATSRLLIGFGIAWMLFNIADSLHSLGALVMQSLLAVPFFALALLARRWPRLAGVLLLVTAVFLIVFLGIFTQKSNELINKALVGILFVGPLLAGGVALLQDRAPGSWEGEP
jgi:hypothetical protein